ncbi:MAG: LON peptidase substrate-binding domain-containing protein [Rhizobiales bacterium]|jgi:ATP-dependent Lon protease|nr:LON peptidase substrate-binding domain-containing protein [Hyphomicrobiales bacterium]
MRDYRDAKAMAQTLRQALKERSVSLTHSESLELVARILGFADWNVLSARIQAAPAPAPTANPVTTIKLPVVPMRDVVFFPQMSAPLWASRVKTVRAIGQAMATDRRIFVVTQRRIADDDPKAADLYEVGVIASIASDIKLEDGTTKLIVNGLRRAHVVRLEADESCLVAEVSPIQEEGAAEEEAEILAREVRRRFESYANVSLSSPPQGLLHLAHANSPGRTADAMALYLSVDIAQRQELLQTASIIERLKLILAMMDADRKAA